MKKCLEANFNIPRATFQFTSWIKEIDVVNAR